MPTLTDVALIAGDETDPHVQAVRSQLEGRGVTTWVLDVWRGWEPTTLEISGRRAILRRGAARYKVVAVWLRTKPFVAPTSPRFAFAVRERREFLNALVASFPRAALVNAPWAQERARNKVYQLAVARAAGLRVPLTWASNDGAEMLRHAHKGPIIYKAQSWLGTSEGTFLFTNVVDPAHTKVETINVAPGLFQEVVPKACEYRVTVIDSNVFSVQIDSQARADTSLDWRRNQRDVDYKAQKLPSDIARRVQQVMSRLELRFGAMDLIVSPAGEFVFLEVNPAGNWLWLEHRLRFGISEAIGLALIKPREANGSVLASDRKRRKLRPA